MIDVYHGDGEEVGWERDGPSSRRSSKGPILSERNLVNQELAVIQRRRVRQASGPFWYF